MKISKKIILAAILLFVFAGNSSSQSLQFCEDVNSDGVPIKASTVFNISSKGGYLKFLTTLPYRVGTSTVSYEIYRVNSDGTENFDTSIKQDVDPSWTWFWKEVTFYDSGTFNVYVYDSDRNFLASSQLTIQYY